MLQKHIAVAAVRPRRTQHLPLQALAAQKAVALAVQAVRLGVWDLSQVVQLPTVNLLGRRLHHQAVQVALSQVALAALHIKVSSVCFRLANRNQVVAPKGSLAQSVTPPTTTSTTE
jgi:hypothetical protein